MVLKGLALGAAVATVAIAIFVALTFQPAPAQAKPIPATTNVVILASGMATPQLQPAQQNAPLIVEAEMSLASVIQPAIARAATAAFITRADLTAQSNASTYHALHSCGAED
jgi:hypothetical protein